MINREIPLYSLQDVIETLKKNGDGLDFASELTGISVDALWEMLAQPTEDGEIKAPETLYK